MDIDVQSLPPELMEEHTRRKKWIKIAYIGGLIIDICMLSSLYDSMKDIGNGLTTFFTLAFMFVFAGGVFCSLVYGPAYVSEKNKDTMKFLAIVLPVVGWIILLYYVIFLLFFKGAMHLLPDTISFIKRRPILTKQEKNMLAQGQYVPNNVGYAAPNVGQYATPNNIQYGAPVNGQYAAPNNIQYGAPVNGQYSAPNNYQYGAPANGQYVSPDIIQNNGQQIQ